MARARGWRGRAAPLRSVSGRRAARATGAGSRPWPSAAGRVGLWEYNASHRRRQARASQRLPRLVRGECRKKSLGRLCHSGQHLLHHFRCCPVSAQFGIDPDRQTTCNFATLRRIPVRCRAVGVGAIRPGGLGQVCAPVAGGICAMQHKIDCRRCPICYLLCIAIVSGERSMSTKSAAAPMMPKFDVDAVMALHKAISTRWSPPRRSCSIWRRPWRSGRASC